MAVSTDIEQKANDIRIKIYGKDVRESLASGLESMSSDINQFKEDMNTDNENFKTNITTEEAQHSDAETARVTAETARASAEAIRQTNETNRQAAETSRVTAETARETAFAGMTHVDANLELSSARKSNTTGKQFDTVGHRADDNDLYALESTGYGIISGGNVSAQSTPNMSVSVAAVVAHLPNGARYNASANSALTVNASDSTRPRTDIVYISKDGIISYLESTLGTAAVPGSRAYTIATNVKAAIAGSNTYTLTTNFMNNDTITFDGVTFTATASAQDSTHFTVGSDIATSMANFATALNANATINAIYTASASNGTIIITEKVAGEGNTPGIMAITGTGVINVETIATSTTADTVTINGVVFTAVLSNAIENEFNVGTDTTATATNLASTLNNNSTISALYTATSSSNVVTLTEKIAGNGNTPTEATTTGTISITNGASMNSTAQIYPSAPNVPDGGLILAQIAVEAGTAAIIQGNITDKRIFKQTNDKLSSQLADIAYNVKIFGAIGDGITDDTIAIQKALNALIDGNKLYFPPGIYLITQPIGLYQVNNITIEGIRGKSIIKIASNFINNQDNGYNGIRLCQSNNSKISNITLDGNKANITIASMNGIQIDNCENVIIEDSIIYNVKGYHGIEIFNSRNCRVIKNLTHDCDGDNIVFHNQCKKCIASQNICYNAGGINIEIEGRTGGYPSYTIARCVDIILSDNICYSSIDHNILCLFSDNVLINNNIASYSTMRDGIEVLGSNFVNISNNTCSNNSRRGILVTREEFNLIDSTSYNINIINNQIHHNGVGATDDESGYPQIEIDAVTNCNIKNNNIRNGYIMSDIKITDNCSYVKIKDNLVADSGGILINDGSISDIEICDNTLVPNNSLTSKVINILSGNNIKISNNKIKACNSKGYTIYFNKASYDFGIIQIQNNILTDSAIYGIWFANGNIDVLIVSGNVTENHSTKGCFKESTFTITTKQVYGNLFSEGENISL